MINNILNLDWSFVYSIINVLFLIVPILLAVAWITVFERKLLAILQRRTGPNVVGIYGVLQPFIREWHYIL